MGVRNTKVTLALLILPWLQIATAQAPATTEYIQQCYRDDPKLTECLKTNSYKIIQKLVKGIPELGIPPIDPLLKDEIDVFEVAGFQLKATDIDVRGISGLRILWNSASPRTTEVYEFGGDIGEVSIGARYDLLGAVFFLPVHTTGTIFVKGKINYYLRSKITYFTENGTKYVNIDDAHIKIQIEDGSMWIGNLGLLEVPINGLLNNNANMRFIIAHFTPLIEETMQQVLLKFTKRLFNKVPFDVMLPEGTGPDGTGNLETGSIETGTVGTVSINTKRINNLFKFLKTIDLEDKI